MIKVLYSCNLCGVSKVVVECEERKPQEDVVEWMNTKVAPFLSRDHDQRSPECHISKLSEVYIPMDGRE